MKYMGSKRLLLENGLGKLLTQESENHDRIVDLFCGAASVSWFAAQKLNPPVFATDLQRYAVVLAEAVIGRTNPMDADELWLQWKKSIIENQQLQAGWKEAVSLDQKRFNTATWSKRAREICLVEQYSGGAIWDAYGGHYFSPTQAATFDAMMASLPEERHIRSICLAAIIISASRCAASPGHTAQPFKATRTAAKFLREAWLRDPLHYAKKALQFLSQRFAKTKGEARVGDAVELSSTLQKTDLVFVDPPYSGVHYSRFYHVLETIARGECGRVEGVGRYPPPAERPASSFSRKSESKQALRDLLERLAHAGCTVLLTFPSGICSNGLTGELVEQVSGKWFSIRKKIVKTRFSTLGGNNAHRDARMATEEMILLMRPL